MSVSVVSVKENPLLKRKEAVIAIEHKGKTTPTRKDLIAQSAKALGASPETVIVDQILSANGIGTSQARVYAYESAELIPALQKEKQLRRMGEGKKPAEEKK